MPRVLKSVLVPYSAARMFELVDGVTQYPQFLPWCSGARVVAARPDGKTVRIDIDYHGVKAHFTTDNVNRVPESIVITLNDGPFRRLHGEWRFRVLAHDACKVEFELAYEFSTHLLEAVIGAVFSHIANTFIDAFVRRAQAGLSGAGMTAPRFCVTVAYAAPGVEALVVVTLPVGATVADAIAQSGIVGEFHLDPERLVPAVFGQRVDGQTPLAPGDRIELTRALIADPKRARRKRAGDPARSKSDSRRK